MNRNDKAYTFFYTRTRRNRVSIRRIDVAKSHFHGGLVAAVLFLGLLSMGFAGAANNHVAAKSAVEPVIDAVASADLLVSVAPKASGDPMGPEDFSQNSGGPSFLNESEDPEDDVSIEGVETRIRQIELLADPTYLPRDWAHSGKINNEFGFRRNPFGGRSYEFHAGMDIDGERGDIVSAPANGVVIKAGWSGGYGNMIEIDHGYGLTTRYGHLSKIDVNVGESVARGQLLGLVGSTGRSTGPHLHYEVRLNDKSINPRLLLSGKSAMASN